MKKGWKAGWIIAGVAAVTGGMFCIAGVALGGRADTIEFNGEHVFDFFSGELFEDDLSEVASPYGAPEEQYTGSERENLFTDVKRMEVEMSVGEIIVEETDGAEIQVTIPEDFRKIQCYQDGEKLTIENTERKSKTGKERRTGRDWDSKKDTVWNRFSVRLQQVSLLRTSFAVVMWKSVREQEMLRLRKSMQRQ